MPDDLEERLRSHANAFDSLLSLIPAKLYFGENTSDQWQRKKQTPEQKRAARIAKLDPDNAKTAKDVMDERAVAARKRKRADGAQQSDQELPWSPTGAEADPDIGKRRKIDKGQSRAKNDSSTTVATPKARKAEKRQAKKQAKEAKTPKNREKATKKKGVSGADDSEQPTKSEHQFLSLDSQLGLESTEEAPKTETRESGDLSPHNVSESTASSSPDLGSTLQSPHHHSVSSSISSIIPPTTLESAATADSVVPDTTSIASNRHGPTPRQRLEARIQALRAARKADGPDERQPRNRQELLEQRRRKEEERKAHKKELRRKAKEEELRKQEEEIAKRFSPGGSGCSLASPRSPIPPNSSNLSFGRVAFGDGSHADHSLSSLMGPRKSRGPSDTGTALRSAQRKASRLAGLDAEKRQDIEEKDMWLNAKRKAHGEKVREDASLLKKALKRQEKGKKKSEKEWRERKEGIGKSQELRQKKRTDNIKKRMEEKGAGRGKKSGGSKTGKEKKSAGPRPGFEGSFKAKNSGSRGKR